MGMANSIDTMNEFSELNNHIDIKMNMSMANITDLKDNTGSLM